MSTNSEINEVIAFIKEEFAYCVPRKKPLTAETTIEGDLRIMGGDAGEFMEAFFRRFPISSKGFEFYPYFHPEGYRIPFFTEFVYKLIHGKAMPPLPSYDLTIGDLARSIRAGKWVNPI